MRRYGIVMLCAAGAASPSVAQPAKEAGCPLGIITARTVSGGGEFYPDCVPIASLPYDGTSEWGSKAQDFESVYDIYDLFIIEDIEIDRDATLSEFRSFAWVTSDTPEGADDFVLRIFEDNGTGFPGEDAYTGRLVMRSTPGAWSWEDAGHGEGTFVTQLDGQCLESGRYFLIWHTRMDFDCCGQSFFLQQAGEADTGGGGANNAWQWNPGEAFGVSHWPIFDGFTDDPTGINYILLGDFATCDARCSDPDCPADLDMDGDADSDDFFLYLDRFAGGDPCADIDGDTDADSDDFFAYLDLFAAGC